MGIETVLLGGLMAGTALMGMRSQKKPPPPPAPEVPATPAPTAREGGATVRVGGDGAAKQETTAPEYMAFTEKRSSGKTLGGLGRSGLGL